VTAKKKPRTFFLKKVFLKRKTKMHCIKRARGGGRFKKILYKVNAIFKTDDINLVGIDY